MAGHNPDHRAKITHLGCVYSGPKLSMRVRYWQATRLGHRGIRGQRGLSKPSSLGHNWFSHSRVQL